MSTAQLLIAVVDDEDIIRKALQRLLRSAGMAVIGFASAMEFLVALPARRPDCVVLDLHMPLMTGFELMARLADMDSNLPVVVITGQDTPDSYTRAIAAGADAYLLKPVDDLVLMDAITRAVAVHQS